MEKMMLQVVAQLDTQGRKYTAKLNTELSEEEKTGLIQMIIAVGEMLTGINELN